MRALVTGATGFIGRHLVSRLRANGHDVVCLVRPSSRVAPLEAAGAALAVGDMTDAESVGRAVGDVEVVFHLAAMLKAPWRKAFLTDNVAGARHVAEACAAAPRPPVLVAVSSLAAAGPTQAGPPRRESDPPAPVSIYGRVKLACDQVLAERAGVVPTTVLRPPMVFGENDPTLLRLLRSVARGWHLVPGLHPQRLAMIHADDLADALITAAERGERMPPPGARASAGTGIYFAAYRRQPRFDEMGRWVARALGDRPVRVVRVPSPVVGLVAALSEIGGRLRDRPTLINLDKWRESRGGSWICDVGKAERDLAFDADVDVVERLRRAADWARQEGLV